VGIVGCEKSNVRSRVATELARQATRSRGEPVLLIDADAKKRRIAKRFRVDAEPGLGEVLAGVADAGTCVHRELSGQLAVMAPGLKKGVVAIGGGSGEKWEQLDEIKSGYGFVVVDLPSFTEQNNAPAVPSWLDEMVLVVEAEQTRVQAAQRAKEAIERAGVRVSGVVLANRREHIPGWLYDRL
jgi:Mrp family chromosome partitioning ATPase